MKETYRELNQENYSHKANDHDTLSTLNSTLYLAYRDINELLERHLYNKVKNKQIKMLDFGCGVGLSTKIVSELIKQKQYAVDVTGVDINEENLVIAKQKLPEAKLLHIELGQKLDSLGEYDLIVCNFVLVEMSSKEMLTILSELRSKLSENGIILLTNPTARAYRMENHWYTFNNKFQENAPTRKLGSHKKLKFIEDQPIKVQVFAAKNSDQSFTFNDYFHSGSSYKKAYQAAGLQLLETHKPLGKSADNIEWEAEKDTPPYKIHLVGR